jgi:uncharacterized protein
VRPVGVGEDLLARGDGERLLIETDLRLVVLDPNSDFVRLGQVRADADPALAERYQEVARGVEVHSAGAPGGRRLRLHAAELDPATQAAVPRLDPQTGP